MNLLLCSEFIDLNDFINTVGFDPNGKKVAFIITASNYDQKAIKKEWVQDRYNEIVQDLGCFIDLIDLEEVQGEELKERLLQSDIIFLNGGMSGYLMDWINESQFKDMLPELFMAGKVFVGSSAGSMVFGENLGTAVFYPGDSEPSAEGKDSLRIVPFSIHPHNQEDHMTVIRANYDSDKLIMIPNGSLIACNVTVDENNELKVREYSFVGPVQIYRFNEEMNFPLK